MQKIATLFHPGSYGTFISWCVYSFSTLNNVEPNFVSDTFNSSHAYRDSPGMPIILPTHSIINGIHNYIFVTYNKSNGINYINNQLEKQLQGNLFAYLDIIFPNRDEVLRDKWNSNEIWSLRELLSFFIMDMIDSATQQSLEQRKLINDLSIIDIDPESFLLDPRENLIRIYQQFGLTTNQWFDTAEKQVELFLTRQKYFNRQDILNDFVTATINNSDVELEFSSLIDEAYIQSSLRSQGYEIKCYNLNVFPLKSNILNKLLDK